ncbi:MAG TPA: hypothetical protein VFO94_08185 [Gammaproteobacteria bacterium]|nr:hypothetical protein [Gammaproteobacteria bacterium]
MTPGARRAARVAQAAAGLMLAAAGLGLIVASSAGAQPPAPAAAPQRPARERAPIDLTGQWVAVITEDWRWRMVTPPVGDSSSIPLNAKGIAATAAWDLDKDRRENGLCKAYGPPGLIRQPTRLRIDWSDADTLRLQFDAGEQTRLLHFTPQPPSERSLQGVSTAQWFRQTQSRGVFAANTPSSGGSLQVRTVSLTPGYLRPNGVPYSENATIKEYFNTFTLPEAGTWLVVTTVVSDPEYLTTDLIMSTQFKKEASRSKWSPRACDIAPPQVEGARQ